MKLLSGDIKVTEGIQEFLNYTRPQLRRGYNVSELHNLCEREWVLHEKFQKPLQDNIFNIERLRVMFGSAIHMVIQNFILGPMGILWGVWQCRRCNKRSEGFMPKEVCECDDKCKSSCIWTGNMERICQLCPLGGNYIYIEPAFNKLFKKYKLSGHIDGIIKTDYIHRVVEIKTTGGNAFVRIDQPYDNHTIQANLYMYLSGLKEASIIYVNRNLEEMVFKEYIVEYDEVLVESFINRLSNLDDMIINVDQLRYDLLPVRICDSKSDRRAKQCPYSLECFNEQLLKKVFKEK